VNLYDDLQRLRGSEAEFVVHLAHFGITLTALADGEIRAWPGSLVTQGDRRALRENRTAILAALMDDAEATGSAQAAWSTRGLSSEQHDDQDDQENGAKAAAYVGASIVVAAAAK
jgi:hypothetical protein